MLRSPELVFFATIVLMVLLFLRICAVEEVPNSQGYSHPSYAENTLHKAPNGNLRHADSVWLGGTFGVLCAPAVVAFMMMGLNAESKKRIRSLYLFGGVYAGLIAGLAYMYWQSIQQPTSVFLLGFPASSSFMLYIVGLFPLVLVFLYMAMFNCWIFSPDDERRFHELLESKEKR